MKYILSMNNAYMLNNKLNWYVLYCQTSKIEQICDNFNKKKDVFAFISHIEEYIRNQENMLLNH